MPQKLRCTGESHCLCLAFEFPRGEPIREKGGEHFIFGLISIPNPEPPVHKDQLASQITIASIAFSVRAVLYDFNSLRTKR